MVGVILGCVIVGGVLLLVFLPSGKKQEKKSVKLEIIELDERRG
jgi:hypothetical protein